MRKLIVLMALVCSLCSFLAVGHATSETTTEKYNEGTSMYIVNADDLHVRTHPSTDGYIVCTLSRGEKVCSLGTLKDDDGDDWYYIIMKDGSIGWVYGTYVTPNK